MNQPTNRFSQFKLKTLLAAVQENGIKFSDPKYRNSLTADKKAKILQQTKELQNALIPKLDEIDRRSVEYFPLGAYIEHTPYRSIEDLLDFKKEIEPSRFGIVSGHEGNKVLVTLEGVKYFVRADPINLRLRFIRSIL